MGKCPHCGSKNIRRRYREHRRYKWRCRGCNRVFRKPKRGVVLWLGVASVVAVASAFFAVQQGMIAVPSTPAQLGESVDRVAKAIVPTATPDTVATMTPESVVAQVPVLTATATHTARPTDTPAARVIAPNIPDTPAPTFTSTPIMTSTATVVPTATPVPTSTPTTTPIPSKVLVLDVEAEVDGYWSDGTANISLSLLLRNEGSLPFQENQPITVSCMNDGNVIGSCTADTEMSLLDGFSPVATDIILRAPMGLLRFDIDYSGDASHKFSFNVPQRILGVDRDTWECFSPNPPNRVLTTL